MNYNPTIYFLYWTTFKQKENIKDWAEKNRSWIIQSGNNTTPCSDILDFIDKFLITGYNNSMGERKLDEEKTKDQSN
ncbi:MAG: hypothetical protein WC523_00050 [Patescibacteria group bacterium]